MSETARKPRIAIPAWLGLLLIYAAFVILRIILAFHISIIPHVGPDESLYFNLARSLWTAGEISVRGQPITYNSLLYPMVIAPLLALPERVNIHQAIQVLNAFLMNTAVFPAWLLARRITGSRRAAWFIALLALIVPDMALTRMIVGENIGYPLLLWALWLAWRAFDTRRVRDALPLAFACMLLYILKPGLIALGIAICLCMAVLAVRRRDRGLAFQAGAMVAVMAAFAILWRVFTQYVLHVDYSFQSVYGNQTPPLTLANLRHVFDGTLLYLYFFPIACLVFPLAVPLAHANSLPERERGAVWSTYLAIALTIVGTCFFIYIDEFRPGHAFESRVHLRYIAGYIPVLYALSLSPSLEGKRMNEPLFAMLAYMIAGTIAFSLDAIASMGAVHTFDALSLAVVIQEDYVTDAKTLFELLLVLGVLTGGYALVKRGWTRRMRGLMAALMVVFSLLNTVEVYKQNANAGHEQRWVDDARQLSDQVDGAPYLFVTGDDEYFTLLTINLDTHNREAMFVVELDDLMENTLLGGAFAPFMPQSYYLTHAVHETPDAHWLVMDVWKRQWIIFADEDAIVYTPERSYMLVPVDGGRPWVHSSLSGLVSTKVQTGSRLSIFDEAVCAQETVSIGIRVMGKAGTALTLTCGGFMHTQVLSGGLEWIDVDVPGSTDGQPLRVMLSTLGEVIVNTFRVEDQTSGI